MMNEQNRQVVTRLIDGINESNIAILDDILSDDFINHNPFPGCGNDGEGYKAALNQALSAFPDLILQCLDMVLGQDKVAVRLKIGGTHQGEMLGIPPTGKSVSWSAMVIVSMKNGKITERWEEQDILGLMNQLRG